MKKIMNLFGILFAILVMVASCSPDDTDFTEEYVNQENRTLQKRDLNNKERNRNLHQGSRGNDASQQDSLQVAKDSELYR